VVAVQADHQVAWIPWQRGRRLLISLRFYADHQVNVERVMTDNGSPYISIAHAIACRALGIKHLRTRPRRPQTTARIERFIRTMLDGWAYGRIYASSRERRAALPAGSTSTIARPHGSLGRHPPITRVIANNLLRSYN
jgi:transposase InsO family protein